MFSIWKWQASCGLMLAGMYDFKEQSSKLEYEKGTKYDKN